MTHSMEAGGSVAVPAKERFNVTKLPGLPEPEERARLTVCPEHVDAIVRAMTNWLHLGQGSENRICSIKSSWIELR
jgi:hypothetical protein